MSVSSNSRKESTESYAAQGMHNTMGILPELAQLNDKNLDNDLPSRVAGSNDTDVPGDVAEADAVIAEANDASGMGDADIEESKRASWGQPSVADENASLNRTTTATEPDRTLGNS